MSDEPPKRRSRRQDPAWKNDKIEARKDIKESCDLLNTINGEREEDYSSVKELRDGNRKLVATALEETKAELAIRNEELRKLREQLAKTTKKEIKEKEKELKTEELSTKISLTREELSSAGIELKSNIKFGYYGQLSEGAKDALDDEISSMLLEKAVKIMDAIGNKPMEELQQEKSKDLFLALGICLDKQRIFARRTPTTQKQDINVNVNHTISDLISLSSAKRLGNLFGGVEGEDTIIDVTPIDKVEDNKNTDPDEDW
jgi:hypothetical protein